MGYYTYHNLAIKCDHTKYNALEILGTLRKENDDAAFAITEDGSCAQSTKWYDAEDQLCNFSKKYPGVLFTLHGEGEEAGDVWNLYIKDGKRQMAKAELKIADFNFVLFG